MKLFLIWTMVQEEMPFSSLQLWWPFFQPSETICAILVDDIKRSNSYFFLIWTSASGGYVF